MSGAPESFSDRLESLASRLYYSLNEEDFNCWAVLSRLYSFRDHRKVLFFINLLLCVASIILAGFSTFLAYLFYDEYYYTVWLTWVGIGATFIMFVTVCIIGMRGAYLVSLDHLLTYFWGAVVFTGPLLLAVIFCLDFYDYMLVWFRHQWELDNFAQMRLIFCEEGDDVNAMGKCAAPLIEPDSWCWTNFNASDCMSFREIGIENAVSAGRQATLTQAIVCAAELGLIAIALALCHRIITDQVLTQSMNEVINYLLILPIAASSSLAYYLWWLTDFDADELEYSWLPRSFLAGAVGIFVALPLGIIAGKFKNKWLLQVYIALMLGVLGTMILNGTISILFAGILEEVFTPTTSELGEIACDKALTGCCCCGAGYEDVENRCPEWQDYEIISLLVLDLKISGITSFGCILYIIGAIIIAILVRTALANYKVDYVGMGKTIEDEEGRADGEGGMAADGATSAGGSGVASTFTPSFSGDGKDPIASFRASTSASFEDVEGVGGGEDGFTPVSFDGAPAAAAGEAGSRRSGRPEGLMSFFKLKGGSSNVSVAGSEGGATSSRRTGSMDSMYSAQAGPDRTGTATGSSASPDDSSSGAVELKIRSISSDESLSSDTMSAVTAQSGGSPRSPREKMTRAGSLNRYQSFGVNPRYHHPEEGEEEVDEEEGSAGTD